LDVPQTFDRAEEAVKSYREHRDAYDKMRDKMTRRIEARFRKARKVLEDVVRDSIADLDLANMKTETY
jgi:prefoldin subunit 5